MIRGLYTAAAGMTAEASRLDVIANNLANATTPGYRRDIALHQAFPDLMVSLLDPAAGTTPIGSIATGAHIEATFPDATTGPLRRTGNPTDVAVLSGAYLAVVTPQGERYTRHGGLAVTGDGRLVTAGGFPVAGVDGTVAGEVEIREDGTVIAGGVTVGQLRLVRFGYPCGLVKEGAALLAASELSGPATVDPAARVEPGCLEWSNVDPVREMVAMITVMRAYEANQQALRAQDEALQEGLDTGTLA